MSKRLHLDPKAEQEANEVASRFMNSSDVVGDMSRAYGQDLSSVRIHTDENAAQKVAPTGADAFSTGKDIFFGRGAFDQSDPASRGLLAHELTHSLQQGIGGDGTAQSAPVSQSAPQGAAQGGVLDWFRKKFGKKKPEMVISEPTLVSSTTMDTGPYTDRNAMTDTGDATIRTFQNTRSYALNQLLQGATREQLQDPVIRRLVLEDYNTNMNARLKGLNGSTKNEMDAAAFRRGAGELHSLNMVLGAAMPEDFSTQVVNLQREQGTDAALDFISQTVEGDEGVMGLLEGTNASFEGVQNYESPEARSAMMMNNLILRSVNGPISKRIGLAQRERVEALKKLNPNITNEEIDADLVRTVDKSDMVPSAQVQKAVNTGKSASASRLRELLVNRFRRH